jgi:UDP-N-acetylmuramyl pentapeptide synthase
MYVQGSLGVQHAYNYAAAAAVGALFDISIEEATRALREHEPPSGRMRIIEGIKDTTLIDDTYNSSPVAVERALLSMKELRGVKRRIAVLGDMLELGQFSVREHERMGEVAAGTVDMLVTIGVRARGMARGALNFGLDEANIFQYDDAQTAARELQEMIHPGDMILVKGSQGTRLEKVVEELMLHPEEAADLLVRQDTKWKER